MAKKTPNAEEAKAPEVEPTEATAAEAIAAKPANRQLQKGQVVARVVRQPLMTNEIGVAEQGRCFATTEKEAHRHGKLLTEGSEDDWKAQEAALEEGGKTALAKVIAEQEKKRKA